MLPLRLVQSEYGPQGDGEQGSICSSITGSIGLIVQRENGSPMYPGGHWQMAL